MCEQGLGGLKVRARIAHTIFQSNRRCFNALQTKWKPKQLQKFDKSLHWYPSPLCVSSADPVAGRMIRNKPCLGFKRAYDDQNTKAFQFTNFSLTESSAMLLEGLRFAPHDKPCL